MPGGSHRRAPNDYCRETDELREETLEVVETLQDGLFDAPVVALAGEVPPLASDDKHAGTPHSGNAASGEGHSGLPQYGLGLSSREILARSGARGMVNQAALPEDRRVLRLTR